LRRARQVVSYVVDTNLVLLDTH